MEKVYGPLSVYIQTPPKSCNTALEDIWKEVDSNLEGVEILLPSAGAVTKILNKRLFTNKVSLVSLDFGSIHDGYEGNLTRTWLRDEEEKVENFLKRF